MPAQVTPVAADAFRTLFRRHPGAVTVVVARGDEGTPAGFTSTSVIAVSTEPPSIAFSVATASSSWPTIRDSDDVTVSFLTADQADIAARFATHGIDRFAHGNWRTLTSGGVVIEDAAAWLAARIVQRVAAGGSRVIVAEVEAIGPTAEANAPLIYLDRRYRSLPSDTEAVA